VLAGTRPVVEPRLPARRRASSNLVAGVGPLDSPAWRFEPRLSQADQRELADESLPRRLGTVVAPAHEPAQRAVNDRSDPAVAPLVAGEHFLGLQDRKLSMHRDEALASDRHLDGLVNLKVAIPLCRTAEPGNDDELMLGSTASDYLEHSLVRLPGPAPDVCQAQESVAEQPAEAPVVENSRRAEQSTQAWPGFTSLHCVCSLCPRHYTARYRGSAWTHGGALVFVSVQTDCRSCRPNSVSTGATFRSSDCWVYRAARLQHDGLSSKRQTDAGVAAALIVVMLVPTAAAASDRVAVFPIAGSKYNRTQTQITFRGVPATAIGPIQVVGSQTGAHSGRIEPDSDGQGGSFLPDEPFAAGETVTVKTQLNVMGSSNGTFSFQIAQPWGLLPYGKLPLVSGAPGACSTSVRVRIFSRLSWMCSRSTAD
jgi:hypothetical protein